MKNNGIRKSIWRMMSSVLAVAMTVGMMTGLSVAASAMDLPDVSYAFSDEVTTGIIRYISQNDGKTNNSPRSEYFDDRYWGDYWLQPHYELECSGPGAECGTASISMALSYVGINKTPQEILDAYNGQTTFDGWGADLQYPSLSEAMDRLSSGDGKYSPAIIHFMIGAPGYPNGHYVLVIGRNGETYSILDCNRDTVWTLSTSDALYGCIDCVMQYYNESAVIQPAVTIPSGVKPINVQLMAINSNGSVVRTGPAKTFPVVDYLDQGATIKAIGSTMSTFGHIWYFLDDGTYIYSGNVEIVSSASVTGITAPSGTLTFGNIFVLKGVISGEYVNAITVNIRNSAGQVVLSAVDHVSGSYSLQGSAIDKAMTFNSLDRGNYTYEVIVSEDMDNGYQCVPLNTIVYTSSFSVE